MTVHVACLTGLPSSPSMTTPRRSVPRPAGRSVPHGVDVVAGEPVEHVSLGGVVGPLPSVVFHRGLLGGALLATVLFWQAVFRDPPVSPSDRRTAAIAVVRHGGPLLGLAAVR
ncbi:hypothetical protein EI982_13280 [Haloplanus rallus]|uniref:Uncharacterized protein n=1 Tax=Haloplanus rallus TaxID=1816183 RepID=A0A6B9F5D3_9EURY|nr:hypothetical protein [Haloplanus rallus]QGX95696.1 hypothetical protein EI982_13280 [Haloplanus rallus]